MLIVGNQKNYMTIGDVNKFLKSYEYLKNVVICPSNIYIPYYLKRSFSVGVQNIEERVVTGEISAKQAHSMGVEWTIIGHSERREKFDERNLGNKVNEALKNKLKVIFCVGETFREREKDLTKDVLKDQLSELFNVSFLENVVIAYEPVWAIGTGVTPSNEEIEENVSYIKRLIREIYNQNIKVLYGGSVKSENIETLKKIESVDGFLIGKASTNYDELRKISEAVN